MTELEKQTDGILKKQYDNDLMGKALDEKIKNSRNKRFAKQTGEVPEDVKED